MAENQNRPVRPVKQRPAKKKTAKKEKSVGRKILTVVLSVFLTLFLIGVITGTIVVGAFAVYVKKNIDPVIDDFDVVSTNQNLTTSIYYMKYETDEDRVNRNGTPVEIESEQIHGSENRIWVPFSQMPENLYEAFISIEDERFWTNDGVDWKRTIGATLSFITGSGSYGGSTITQQLIKNITGENEVRVQRKLQEIMRALYLNKTKSKTEILELYLNTIYLSQGCYGVQAAAKTYFNKDVSELSLVECAAIASITQAPTKWDPKQNPENNAYRRRIVLGKMLELGKITQAEYDEAVNAELVIYDRSKKTDTGEATEETQTFFNWYTEAVITSVVQRLQKEKNIPESMAYNMVYSGGLKIYTVMDPYVQDTLEDVYLHDENFPQLRGAIQPQSSMVVIDPQTGDVLGLVGSRGEKVGNRLLNYATDTRRSPGSAIKPVTVYAPALEYGIITEASVYDDVPVNFSDGYYYDASTGLITYVDPDTKQTIARNTGWPANAPAVYQGLCTIQYAIQVSKNTVAVKVLQDLGTEASFDFAKNKVHLDSLIEFKELNTGEKVSDKGLAALGMGQLNYGLTNLELTAAYSMFANKGVYNQPRLFLEVRDSDNNLILDDGCSSEAVISEENATIMTKMLQRVVNYGTGTMVSLRGSVDVAGKTGTTTNDQDRTFYGYTPYYIGGVWFGYSEPQEIVAAGNPSATVWNEVMTRLHQKYFDMAANDGVELKHFTDAPGVVTAWVCRDSGLLVTEACKADPRGQRGEQHYFTEKTVPRRACDVHVLVDYDKVTKAVACPNCPKEDVVKVGLLEIKTRNFPININVADAQYTTRPLPEGVEPGLWEGVPFYINVLKGRFPGTSGSGDQYNHYCFTHFKNPPETQPETQAETVPETVAETEPPIVG